MKGKMKPCGTKPRHREHKKTKTNKHLQKKKTTEENPTNRRKRKKKRKKGKKWK